MIAEFKLPELGENITSGDVVKVLVREGNAIAANDGVIELETDKAVVEIPCPTAGKVAKIHVSKGQTIKVGQVVLSVESEEPVESQAAVAAVLATESPHPSPLPKGEGTERAKPQAAVTPAGPEARRLARELGVELAQVQGTGKGGRISTDDVQAAAAGAVGEVAKPQAEVGLAGELGRDAYGPIRRERMSKIRRTIAAQMVKSAGTIPHVTNFDDADVTDLEQLRKTVPTVDSGPAVKFTMLPFVVKAVSLALRQHPVLNASIDEAKEEIIYKQYINVGIAVDTPRGLVVPVMRNADGLSILQIAAELARLTARARGAEFGVDELRGGTFSISNLGAVGGRYSTPVINHPEAAVLLVGRSQWSARVEGGKIEGRLMMPLSLSYDHRVVDGAAAARFLNDVIDYLQSPGKLLLVKSLSP